MAISRRTPALNECGLNMQNTPAVSASEQQSYSDNDHCGNQSNPNATDVREARIHLIARSQ
jgi:hypothetical protein